MEDRAKYITVTPEPKFYRETCTLTEHQLLKRIRQIANGMRRTILIFEIISRDDIRELGKVPVE